MTVSLGVVCYLAKSIESALDSKAVEIPKTDPKTVALATKEGVYVQS